MEVVDNWKEITIQALHDYRVEVFYGLNKKDKFRGEPHPWKEDWDWDNDEV